MAYNEELANRIRQVFIEKDIAFEEKKMFGGWCLMLDEKMCIGVVRHKKYDEDAIMCRVGDDYYERALSMEGAVEMDFGGRPMKGFVFVLPEGYHSLHALNAWCQLCIDYNPFAKKTKKK